MVGFGWRERCGLFKRWVEGCVCLYLDWNLFLLWASLWKKHGWIKCSGFLTRLTLLVISLWSSLRVEMSNDQNHGHLNKTRNPCFLFLAVQEGFPKLSFDLLVLILCQGWMAIAWWKSCQRISSSRYLAYCLDKMISLWQEGPINFSLVVKTNTSRNEVSGHNPPCQITRPEDWQFFRKTSNKWRPILKQATWFCGFNWFESRFLK